MTSAATSRFSSALALLVLVLAVGWHAWWASRNWHSLLLAGHEFRQAQTALSIQAMATDGFRLDYSTPVLGKPWSIPFEFPVYQGIVHVLARATGLDVIAAGRWTSLVAFYLGLPALVWLLRRTGLSPTAAALATTPVLFAPVYLLYSRAVLIESTALAASAWFLALLMAYRQKKTPLLLTATLAFGALAVLAKATTWSVFCLPWAGCVLFDLWRARARGWRALDLIVDDVFLVGLPLLLIGFGWVWMTDRIKEFNPLGAFLTSDRLAEFNFGTLAQRADPEVGIALWHHWTAAVMPWWGLGAGLIGAVCLPRIYRGVAGLGWLTFLGAQFVFLNLYAVHDYYLYAAAWSACLAVGVVAGAVWDSRRQWYAASLPAILLLTIVCAGEFSLYHRDFYRIQTAGGDGRTGLTDAIKRLTAPGDVIVAQAPDWSSTLAFQSERRTLMISDYEMYHHPVEVRRSISLLSDEHVPLVVFLQSQVHVDWLLDRIRDFDLEPFPLFFWENRAVVYARKDADRAMRSILEREHFAGVTTDIPIAAGETKPAVPIAGTAAAAEITMLDPLPETGSFPFGIGFRYVDGKKLFFVHPPTVLDFAVPAGATRIELGYRIEPAALGKENFDGAYVILDLKQKDGRSVSLFHDWLTPQESEQPHYATIPLHDHRGGTLVFRTLAGPANNAAYDWVLLEYLRIR